MIILYLAAMLASWAEVEMTLRLIEAGRGREINPLMRWALKLGVGMTYLLGLGQTILAGFIACFLIGAGAAACGWALLILLAVVRVGSLAWNYHIWVRR